MKKGELLSKLCLNLAKIHNKMVNWGSYQQDYENMVEKEFYKLSYLQSKYLNPILNQNTRNLDNFREYLQTPIKNWGIKDFQEYEQLLSVPLFRRIDVPSSPRDIILGHPTEIFNQIVMEGMQIEQSGKQYLITDIRDQLEEESITENRDSQDLYIRFRKFLIEHPIIEKFDKAFTKIQQKLKIKKWDYYEPIAAHQQYQDDTFLCPVCHYPLKLDSTKKEWSCPCLWCQEKDAFFQYEKHPLNLKVHHRYDVPVKRDVNNHIQIIEELWRFTTVPGIIELELEKKVHDLGFSTHLWPDFDHQGDLKIILSNKKCLFVDAKCWLNLTNLHHYLIQHEEKLRNQDYWKDKLQVKIIVIPNVQEKFIPNLQKKLSIYQIYSLNQFIKKLQQGEINAF